MLLRCFLIFMYFRAENTEKAMTAMKEMEAQGIPEEERIKRVQVLMKGGS